MRRGWPLVRQIYIPNVDKACSNDFVIIVDGRPALRIQKKKVIQSEQVFDETAIVAI